MKLFALDMDGTSLNDEGQLAGDTIQALATARRQGWTVCFVTGRTRVDIAPLGDTWRVADYLITNNGGKTIRSRDDAVVNRILVKPAAAESLIAHCLANDLQLYVLGGRTWWLNIQTPRDRRYIDHVGSEPETLRNVSQVTLDDIEGFMSLRDWLTVWQWLERADIGLQAHNSEPECIDILPREVTKWNAVAALTAELGIETENVVAMGNYNNDLDMIRAAGVGIAVPSAPDEVRQAADHVTQNDYNSGAVAEAVAEILLPKSNVI